MLEPKDRLSCYTNTKSELLQALKKSPGIKNKQTKTPKQTMEAENTEESGSIVLTTKMIKQ